MFNKFIYCEVTSFYVVKFFIIYCLVCIYRIYRKLTNLNKSKVKTGKSIQVSWDYSGRFAGLIIYTPAKLHGQRVHWYFRFTGKYCQIYTAKKSN